MEHVDRLCIQSANAQRVGREICHRVIPLMMNGFTDTAASTGKR